jgi:UDP-GlcNAc:undecaprenyl-phosphate GlcNAc-1-phosphate transferase
MTLPTYSSFLPPVIAALLLSAVVTPIVAAVARRFGAVAAPKPDRWHKRPTAMFGGAAIFLSVTVVTTVFLPHDERRLIVILCSALLFALGAIDDVFHIKPYQKLIGQILGAAVPVYLGLKLPWTHSQLFNVILTIFWLIGITNAINLLDNMDGLAAGVAAIAALFLGFNFIQNGQMQEALLLAILAATLVGFLIYNSNPASIFMGDCGSLYIGFLLASTTLLSTAGTAGRSRSLFSVLAAPVLIFVIPIFDTTLVTMLRRISGRAISQGGRDHTSHRLVALGVSERKAVWMLYGFAVVSGALGVTLRRQHLDVSIAAIVGLSIVLALIGVYLGGVKVYGADDVRPKTALTAFLIDVSYRRRLFEVLLDVVLVLLAYYLSYALLFGPMADTFDWRLFGRSAPLVLFVKMAAFLALGVYRGLWRYTSLKDVITYGRAVFFSSVVTVLVLLFAFRFIGFSRTLFVIDGVLLFLFVSASRFAFRLLRALLPTRRHTSGKRVVIYGAGDGGELLYRELMNNPELGYTPVAFIDDDLRKTGRVLHGIRILDPAADDLSKLLEDGGADEIVVSSSKVSEMRLERLLSICPARIPVKRMHIEFVPILRATLPALGIGDARRSYVIPAEPPFWRDASTTVDTPPSAEPIVTPADKDDALRDPDA